MSSRGLSRRDALLVFIGAAVMYLFNASFQSPHAQQDLTSSTQQQHSDATKTVAHTITRSKILTRTATTTVTAQVAKATDSESPAPAPYIQTLKETTMVHHTPGWTLFHNLYMANGTFYIVSDSTAKDAFPIVNIITKGLPIENDEASIKASIATSSDMAVISLKEAERRWSSLNGSTRKWRVWSVLGNTLLNNDPRQFLGHYYHFVAEIWFGIQAFWYGAHSDPIVRPGAIPSPFLSYSPHLVHFDREKPSTPKWLDQKSTNPNEFLTYPYRESDYLGLNDTQRKDPPAFTRAIFTHVNQDGWRDGPGIDSFFLRAAYPSLTVEHQEDWQDRVKATVPPSSDPMGNRVGRAWHFPVLLLVDRSAASHGEITGIHTQRAAAQAWEYMFAEGRLRGWRVGAWWEMVRRNVLQFVGAPPVGETVTFPDKPASDDKTTTLDMTLPLPIGKPVISYISRQNGDRRALSREGHDSLVAALDALSKRRGWDFFLIEAEKMTIDEQLKVAANTTVMIGVHGNGLSHLVWMPPTRYSTVVEIFWPGGFLHDYQWISRALGMRHWAVWNDTYYTHPNKPGVAEVENFHSVQIPVHGPAVAELIEFRIDGKI